MSKVKTAQQIQNTADLPSNQSKSKKLYLPVKNKTISSTSWKSKIKQGVKWGIKQ